VNKLFANQGECYPC